MKLKYLTSLLFTEKDNLAVLESGVEGPHFLGHFQYVNFFNFLFKSQSKFLWS